MSGNNRKPRKTPSVRGGSISSKGSTGFDRQTSAGSIRGSSMTVLPVGPNGKGFGSDFTTNPNSASTWSNPYDGKTSGQGAAINRLYETLGKGGNPLQSLLSLLDGRSWDEELWSMFFQFALQQAANSDQRAYDQLVTKDQREYDWNLLQDSRLYNNPQNELARLMGSGISRDAAIQMLSGSAGNLGGSTGGSPVTNSPVPVGSASGTPGDQKLATVQTALQGVQMVANLVSQGIDAFTAVNQAQMMQAQNYMTQSQLQAFKGVNDISQAFDRAVFDGTLTIEDVQGLRTADDYYNWINDHADTKMIKPLIQSGAVNAAFGSTFGRQMMNHHLEQTRQSRDSGVVYDQFVRSQILDNAIRSLQPSKIGAELSLIGSQQKVNEQSIVESCTRIAIGEAQIEVLNEQGKWYAVQSDKTTAEQKFIEAQTQGQLTTNKQLSLNYEFNEAGFPMLKQNRIDELTAQALRWNIWLREGKDTSGKDTKVDPKDQPTLYQMQREWLLKPENAADAAYVLSCYYGAVGDFATDHPSLYGLGVALDACGLGNILRVGSQTAQAGEMFLIP